MDKLTSYLFLEKRASLLAVLLLPLLLVLTQCGSSDDKATATVKSAKLVVSVSINTANTIVTASVSNTGSLASIVSVDGLVFITGATAAVIALKADGTPATGGTAIGVAKDIPIIAAGADTTVASDASSTAIAIGKYYGVCITGSVCVSQELLAVAVLEPAVSINTANTIVTASVSNTGSLASIVSVDGLVFITGATAAVIALKADGTPITGGTAIGVAKDIPIIAAGANTTVASDASSTAIAIDQYYGVCLVAFPGVCASAQVVALSATLTLTDLVVGVVGAGSTDTDVQSEATDLTLSVKVGSDLALASGDAILRYYRSETDYNDATVTPASGIQLGGDVSVGAVTAAGVSAVLVPTKKATPAVGVNAISTTGQVTVPILDVTSATAVNSYFYGVCVYTKTAGSINNAPELCKSLEVNIQGVNLVLAVTLNTANTIVTASITNSGNIASTELAGGLVYITGDTEAVIALNNDDTIVTGGTEIGAAGDLSIIVSGAAAATSYSDTGTALASGVFYGVCVKGTLKQITGSIQCASGTVP